MKKRAGKKLTSAERLERELDDLYSFAQSACLDMATGEHGYGGKAEAAADEMFNDTGIMGDLLGDRIHDAFVTAGCAELRDNTDEWNKAVRRVCDSFSHLDGLFDRLKH